MRITCFLGQIVVKPVYQYSAMSKYFCLIYRVLNNKSFHVLTLDPVAKLLLM